MKINCSPLLYGRTFTVDFASQFLVQPDFFSEADAAWAFSIVSSSMDRSNFVDSNGRCVIFGNGQFTVVGLVTVFEELFKRCGRKPVYNRLDHEKGRPAYGFIGIVVRCTGASQVFDVPMDVLLDLYCETIAPIWNRIAPENAAKARLHEVDVTEVRQDAKSEMIRDISASCRHSKTAVFKDDIALREKVSHCALSLALSGVKIVFCSNADEIRQEYRRHFNVVTCANPGRFLSTDENISRSAARRTSDKAKSNLHDEQGYDRILRMDKSQKPDKGANIGKQSKRGEALSYDDIIEQNDSVADGERVSPSDSFKKKSNHYYQPKSGQSDIALDEEISRYNRTKKSKISPADGVLVLGAAAGVIYCVIGAIHSANPIVLAIAGAATVVLIGVEAKRIIDRFS